MRLPFTHAEFLDVFGAYNTALWPAVAALWVVTAGLVVWWFRRGEGGRGLIWLLAAHWIWSGVAYQWIFFRRINPAAALFGGAFVLEGLILIWLAGEGTLRFRIDGSPRGVLGIVLVVYALLYPAVGLAFGLAYPRMPVFAVPCPTTLLTAGLLLTASRSPRSFGVVPLLWAVIGASAAFALGIRADLALVAAAVLLAIDLLAPHALGVRAAGLEGRRA